MNEFTIGVWAVTGLLGEVGYVFGEIEGRCSAVPNATLVGTVNVERWDEVKPLWTLLATSPIEASSAGALP